ncbi:MAG TPA: cob(I)yrinic acid a,c-diamide adenosyltransferase [Bacteroidales bacterium]|nr:cob(I)yrinic acid a,c-diamide adenosyltransferase [Bacteroidales bacterium]HNS46401.1 cob(I)yrinic acid a,c-diamide adenosyltransferase [Bacteroidales bacterium]
MAEEIKIYTKTGDAGETSLIGGKRVPKFDPRIEAYGTVDELNSYLGLLRDLHIDKHSREILLEIQDRLFTAESLLAAEDPADFSHVPHLHEEDVVLLEKEMDAMSRDLPQLVSFILPGGHPVVSHCHIARCICRRAERLVIKLAQEKPVDQLVIKYLNRLSDYLFILSRKFSKDFNVVETIWKARI